MLKSRRQAHYTKLISEGFLHAEAVQLSKLPVNTSALKALREWRSSKFASFNRKAERRGWSPKHTTAMYRKHITNVYRRHGWLTQSRKGGKRSLSIWEMYRQFEKEHPPEDKQDAEYRKLARLKRHKKGKQRVNLKDVVTFRTKSHKRVKVSH